MNMKQYKNIKKMMLVAVLAQLVTLSLSVPAWALEQVGVVGATSASLFATGDDGLQRTLKQGDVIFLNDNLSTDKTGRAQIIFKDRSTVSINENAQLRIDSFVYNPKESTGKLSLNSVKGAFRFIGGALSKKNPVEVHTPVATIGIRGGIVDAHIAAGSGETEAVFVYGKEMTLANAGGETVSTTSIGAGFSLDKANGVPKQMTPDQVATSVSAFKKTEGGATVGVKKIPTHDDVKAKTQELKTEEKQPEAKSEQGSSGQNTQNSDANSASNDEKSNTNEQGATLTSEGDGSNVQDQKTAEAESMTASATPQAEAANATPTLDAPKVDVAQFESFTPIAAANLDVKSVSEAVNNASTDTVIAKAVDRIAGGDGVLKPVTPALPPVVVDSDGDGTKTDGSGTGTKLPAVVDVTKDSENTTGVVAAVTTSPVTGYSTAGYFYGDSSNGYLTAASASEIGLVKTDGDVYGLSNGVLSLLLPDFDPNETSGAFTYHVSADRSDGFTVNGYTVANHAMTVFNMTNDTTKMQRNMIVGELADVGIGYTRVNSGVSFYTLLPELNQYQTNYAGDVNAALASPTDGVFVDWQSGYFVNAHLNWLRHGQALESGEDNDMVIVGRVRDADLKLQGQAIEVSRTTESDHDVHYGSVESHEMFGSTDNGVDGARITASIKNFTNAETIAKIHEAPLVRNESVTSSDLPWLDGDARDNTTSAPMKGYAAGVLNVNVDAAIPAGGVVYSSGATPSNVTLEKVASDAKVGMHIHAEDVDGGTMWNPRDADFGLTASKGSAYVNKNTFAAVGENEKSFVVSGNMTGVNPSRDDYHYTQWGVWGGDATVGGANSRDVAELVPYVVGEVTQTAYTLTGDATYEGDAYASIVNGNSIKNYQGDVRAEASFGNAVGGAKTITVNVKIPDVEGHDLSVSKLDAAISTSGNAVFTGGTTSAGYNGTDYTTGVSMNGALFGGNAQEIGGNFAFSNVAGLKGAGVYQGVTTDNITRH